MPKLIENLRENLLGYARGVVLEQGYDALTVRGVAAACDVAVGTVYNYFPSKDILVASVMLEDWQRALEAMRARAARTQSALDGLRGISDAIAAFARIYRGAWAQYSARSNAAPVVGKWHHQLISQLCAIIQPLLERFGCLFHPSLTAFLAETLLSASIDPESRFDDLAPILTKLLQ